MLKYILSIFIILVLYNVTCCQNKADSLLKIITSSKNDTLKVNTYYALFETFINNNADKAITYNKKGLELSKKINFLNGEAKAYNNFGITLIRQSKYDSALIFHNQALVIYSSISNLIGSAKVNSDMSVVYWRKGDFKTSMAYQIKALNIYEKLNNYEGISYGYNFLGILNSELYKYEPAINYYLKAIEIRLEHNDELQLGSTYMNIGVLYGELKRDSLAFNYFNKSLEIHKKYNNLWSIPMVYASIADLHNVNNNYKEAVNNYLYAIKSQKNLVDSNTLASLYIDLGNTYTSLKEYTLAEKYIKEGTAILQSVGDNNGVLSGYNNLSKLYKKQEKYELAYNYFILYSDLKDSIAGSDEKKYISELETKYETEKKDLEIINSKSQLNLLAEKSKQKTTTAIAIITSLILFFFLFFSRFKNKKNKQLIQQENEASLKIIQSEQTERMRIARELHDGIGQKLTVLKMYASVKEDENKKQIELLDNTITEVRGISHNLMPEIINLGLVTAVKDLCSKINEVGTIQCVFNYNESKPLKFATNIELSIYRIIQEVLNNMIKHANAKTINVSFVVTSNNLKINIADDGVGFDTKKIHTSSGIGWSNIITRAKIINANLYVNSNNKGTNIVLNINL